MHLLLSLGWCHECPVSLPGDRSPRQATRSFSRYVYEALSAAAVPVDVGTTPPTPPGGRAGHAAYQSLGSTTSPGVSSESSADLAAGVTTWATAWRAYRLVTPGATSSVTVLSS